MVENYDRLDGETEVPEFLLESKESYVPEFARAWRGEQAYTQGESTEGDANISTAEKLQAGALRGTAVHRAMAGLDMKKLLELDVSDAKQLRGFVEDELRGMVEKKYITVEMEQLIYRNSIIDFLIDRKSVV